jgi:hypothetical protein
VAFVRQTQMGAGADEVRSYRQPQDRQGAQSRRAALTAWTRRKGDRIEMPFAAAHESVHGPTLTCGDVRFRAAAGGRADAGQGTHAGAGRDRTQDDAAITRASGDATARAS